MEERRCGNCARFDYRQDLQKTVCGRLSVPKGVAVARRWDDPPCDDWKELTLPRY